MSMLKQDNTRKGWAIKLLELEPKIKTGEDVEYKVEAIKDSTIYITKATEQLLELYFLIF